MKKDKYISVYEGKKGISYQVMIPYLKNGESLHKRKTFSQAKYGTKQKALSEAKKWRDTTLVQIANDSVEKDKKVSLKALFESWLSSHSEFAYETRRKHESLYKNHIAPVIDEEREFKTIDWKEMKMTLVEMRTKVYDDQIKRVYQLWNNLCLFAINEELTTKNQAAKINEIPHSLKPKNKKREKYMSVPEIEEVLELISENEKDERNRILYLIAVIMVYYEGIRPSEVFGLTKEAIDFENGRIYILRKVGINSEKKGFLTTLKTDSSERTIPIHKDLVEPLRYLVENADGDELFRDSKGRLITGTVFSDRMNKLTNKRFNIYILRHQFATDHLRQGIDPKTIKELMGHSCNNDMTIYYATTNEELKEKAINNKPPIHFQDILYKAIACTPTLLRS